MNRNCDTCDVADGEKGLQCICADCGAPDFPEWKSPRRVKVYRCKRCQHEWAARKPEKPVICPKCKTPYWDKAKVTQNA